jgi:hypothetical protein
MPYQSKSPVVSPSNVDNASGASWAWELSPFQTIVQLDDGTEYADHSDFMHCHFSGFSIPTGATITGIRVFLVRNRDATPPSTSVVTDQVVQLLRENAPVGDNKASYGWPASDTPVAVYYGGDGDLWGETWTPADINHAGFGFRLAAESDGADVTELQIRSQTGMVVWYTEGGGPATSQRRRVVWI